MMPDSDAAPLACSVCGAKLDVAMSAACNWCGGRFHLNQRSDVEAKDCGRVWIDEQFMALQFACDRCLAAESGSKGVVLPPPRAAASTRRRYRRRE